MENLKPTAQTGALTLVLLTKMYKSQMIALLVKNGIVVSNNDSEQQITSLMANLLKVSKSFSQDLNDFVTNPSVTSAIINRMKETTQYSGFSGNGYFNSEGDTSNMDSMMQELENLSETDPIVGTPVTPKKGFFSGLNFGDLLTQGMNLFGNYTKAQSDAEIAKQHGIVAQAQNGTSASAGSGLGGGKNINSNDSNKDTGMSTTTIVLLSLLGVAVLGTLVYFVAKPKK